MEGYFCTDKPTGKNMTFTNILKNLFLAFCLIFASCHISKHGKRNDILPAVWQGTDIEVDGDSKDWPSPYPNYDSKGKIGYVTANDGQFLYVSMETGDELTLMKILKNGMLVFIDTGGGREQRFRINYPLPSDNNELFEMSRPSRSSKGNSDQNNILNRQFIQKAKSAAAAANQYSLEGFGACSGGFMVSQSAPCGLHVKADIDGYNELVWEAKIPLSSLYGKGLTPEQLSTKTIGLCFSIKGYKKPESKSDNNNSASQGMSNSMRGGGSRGAGPKSAPVDPLQHLFESTKTWKFFRLAASPPSTAH